jgi:adenylate cyclase class IV
MPPELELKAVIPDADALRATLRAAGAATGFHGRMSDRRFDRQGELTARDEVLRVRTYHHSDGSSESVLAWKGPTGRSPQGYKLRQEIELGLRSEPGAVERLLAVLGYTPVHAIDREVEVYRLHDAVVRLERYPRMDPLVEVEGDPASIEAAVGACGIPREAFTADALADFVRRFEARTGTAAVLSAEQHRW